MARTASANTPTAQAMRRLYAERKARGFEDVKATLTSDQKKQLEAVQAAMQAATGRKEIPMKEIAGAMIAQGLEAYLAALPQLTLPGMPAGPELPIAS